MCREELRLLLSRGEKALLRDNQRTDGLYRALAEDGAGTLLSSFCLACDFIEQISVGATETRV